MASMSSTPWGFRVITLRILTMGESTSMGDNSKKIATLL
jgi:hypothetical protein